MRCLNKGITILKLQSAYFSIYFGRYETTEIILITDITVQLYTLQAHVLHPDVDGKFKTC